MACRKLANKSRGYYRCCEVGNHSSINQDEYSLDSLQILYQNGQEFAKPHIHRMRYNIGVSATIFHFLPPPHLLHCFFG
jgi:hypothetical protein